MHYVKGKKYKNRKHKTRKNKIRKHKTRKNYNIKAGSRIFDGTKIINSDLTYNGKPFFRKIFYYSKPPTKLQTQTAYTENKIVKILMENPHSNIATYFDVNDRYVDMEELNTKDINLEEIKKPMENAKQFLQGLGIMYIDWKTDNIGKDKYGNYKLFDFDGSGLIDKNNKWIIEPAPFYSYKKAIENGITKPKQMDDWLFDYNILKGIDN